MAGKFTVAVNNDGTLAKPFNSGGALDFIDNNGIATDTEVNDAKTKAIADAKTETTKQVGAVKTELTTEINKKVNTTDYNSKVSSIESSISSIETTISKLNDTYATDAEVATAKSEAIATANSYTNEKIGNIIQFNVSVEDELPTTNIKTNTIYLVPATNTVNNNVRDEYLYIKNEDTGEYEWEQIGTTAINLEPIYTELEELKDMMPEVIPNLNILPTITMTSNNVPNGSLYCVGEEVEFGTITTNFNSGKIDPQGQSESPYRCGTLTSVTYSGSGWGHTNETSLPTEIKQSYSFTNTISKYTVSNTSTISWTAAASYDIGVQPLSNKGKEYGSPYPAGTKTATLSITGTYPFFATTSSIESTTKQSLVKLNTSSIKTAMVGCTDTNFWVLEVPACWTITNVTGAASGQLGGNAANAVAQWTKTNITKTIQGNNIKYYRYAYGANNAPKKGADTLTFSISYDANITLVLTEGETW